MLKLTRIDNLRAMSACTPTPEVSLQRGEPPLRASSKLTHRSKITII